MPSLSENFLKLAYANVRSTFTDVAWGKFESAIIALQSQTSASWYINNRDVTVGSLLRDLVA